MYLAVIQLLAYTIFVVALHAIAPQPKKIFSQIGLVFALMAGFVLLSDYFIQFSVVPVSLMNGETDGIALLTQYNPHGIFIVLEELGYLLIEPLFCVFCSRVWRQNPPGSFYPLDICCRFYPDIGCPGSGLNKFRNSQGISL